MYINKTFRINTEEFINSDNNIEVIQTDKFGQVKTIYSAIHGYDLEGYADLLTITEVDNLEFIKYWLSRFIRKETITYKAEIIKLTKLYVLTASAGNSPELQKLRAFHKETDRFIRENLQYDETLGRMNLNDFTISDDPAEVSHKIKFNGQTIPFIFNEESWDINALLILIELVEQEKDATLAVFQGEDAISAETKAILREQGIVAARENALLAEEEHKIKVAAIRTQLNITTAK